MGAVLVGSKAVMARSRTLRRMLGGTPVGHHGGGRAWGVQTMTDRLVEDHARAA